MGRKQSTGIIQYTRKYEHDTMEKDPFLKEKWTHVTFFYRIGKDYTMWITFSVDSYV